MENKIIGIVGINGEFGQWLKKFFENLGYEVIGSDKQTQPTNDDVCMKSDVVIFSVPIMETPSIIESLLPHFRADQLLMDVTSIKQPAIEAMLKSPAQVVGLHPMFRPNMPSVGQTIVFCPARLTSLEWDIWVTGMLKATGAQVKYSTAVEHDHYMETVQVDPHLGNLISALLITERMVSVEESLTFTSPFYRVVIALMGRLVGGNPDLYTSIIMGNPETLEMLNQKINIMMVLRKIIVDNDKEAMMKLFAKAKEHFGPDIIKDSNELFTKILGVISKPQ
jgi:prephenate dehydrogenase